MTSDSLMINTAKRIPEGIRKAIVTEELITKAVNMQSINSPMEFLFDVYVEFIDSVSAGEFSCAKCRQKVLDDFKRLQPYLIKLVNQ